MELDELNNIASICVIKFLMSVPTTILALAAARGSDKTICPSEVARTLWPEGWRTHMEEVRTAAFALRDEGKIQILQKGKEVPGTVVKGPLRIRIL